MMGGIPVAKEKNADDDQKKKKKPKKEKKEKKPKAKKEKAPKGKKAKKGKKGEQGAPENVSNVHKVRIIMGPGGGSLSLTKRSRFWKFVMGIVTYAFASRRKLNIERVRMQNLKPPYILLCSHQSFADYLVVERAVTFHNDVNHLVEASEFANSEAFMKSLGCIPLRRFSADGPLIYHIKETIMQKKIVAIYPEAHLCLAGVNSPLPDSLFKIIKTMKVPVVVLKIRGNYIAHPCWSKVSTKVPTEAQLTQVLSAEEIETLEAEEIGKKILSSFRYDDYWWQLQSNVKLVSKQRAEGLEFVLYRCPCCGIEFRMNSHGDVLYCDNCGQEWNYTELGTLEPVPDSAHQDVLEEIRAAEVAAAQKVFDAERMVQAQRDYNQARRVYEYNLRKRQEELANREALIREARQRLEMPPEFEPLPPMPEKPEPLKELPFVPVEIPPPEPLPELSRVPQWFEYQREKVAQDVNKEAYKMEIPVQVEVLRELDRDFIMLGEGRLLHNASGFKLVYREADGTDRIIEKPPLTTYSLHIDFDFRGKGPFIDISTANETFYLYPRTTDCSVTKVALAAEEMYKLARKVLEEQLVVRESPSESE